MKKILNLILCFAVIFSCSFLFSACSDKFEGKYHFENITVELVDSLKEDENYSEFHAILDEYGAKDYTDLINKVTKQKREEYADKQETKYTLIFKTQGDYIFKYKDMTEKGTWSEIENTYVANSTESSAVVFPNMFYKGRPGKIYFKDTSSEFIVYFNYSK